MWPQKSYFIPLSLSVLICQMRLLTATVHGYWRRHTHPPWDVAGCAGPGPSHSLRPRPRPRRALPPAAVTVPQAFLPPHLHSRGPDSYAPALCWPESPTCRSPQPHTPCNQRRPRCLPRASASLPGPEHRTALILCRTPPFSKFSPHCRLLMLTPTSLRKIRYGSHLIRDEVGILRGHTAWK